MMRYVEKIPMTNKDELGAGDIKLMFFNDVIAFDHLKQKIYLITNIDGGLNDTDGLIQRQKNHLKELMEFISKPTKRRVVQFDTDIQFESNTTKETFMKKVEKAKDYIKNGDIFQVVPSQIFKAKLSSNLFDVYRVLRIVNPSPYMYLMQFDDLQLAGASPETLVKVQDGTVTTMPIAGTRPRGKTEEEDKRLDKELFSDPKELAEHNMLVDLARNDIGKISEIGSVEVTEYMALQKFSHVTHISSTVQGKLKNGLNSIDVIRSILPAENKEIALAILKGEKSAKRDMVVMNSAVALYTALENKTLRECVELAEEMIDSGKALMKLEAFIEATHLLGEVAI